MKQIVSIVCLLALLLSACSVAEQTPTISEGNYDYGIYQLTFQEKQIYNNRVGNDWTFTYTHNSEPIKSGYTITESLGVFSFYSIDVEVREKDKIDDVATGTLYAPIFDGGSVKATITVTENAGTFKGNTALWEISCEVKLVKQQRRIPLLFVFCIITF